MNRCHFWPHRQETPRGGRKHLTAVFPELEAVLRTYLSGSRAQQDTAFITQFYRSPGSSGYHAATQFAADAMRDAGADEVVEETYPLDGETRLLGRVMPPAWEPVDAELVLVEPARERLIGYPEIPSTLPWWCGSTPEEGLTIDVVDIGLGLSPADYEGKAIRGNAVLIRDAEARPKWTHAAELAQQHGAAGIITDYLHSQTVPWRTRRALPEAVQLLRFPPRWDNPWAFSVGFDVAERLARLASQGPVRVHARVSARTFSGQARNVVATIRGAQRPEESVLFVAHTSAGTKPCANCAAGPALMIELCRAIQTAIRNGTLPRPARSLRFLFVAEGLGSIHFIHKRRADLEKIKATICLDSVGHRQERLKSSLVFYRSPDSVPSYVNDLGVALIEGLPKEADWPFKNAPLIPLVNFHELPYTPWSDNHYWVAFGVPAPLIMSWPDLYFHTQLLTAEHTDPMVFERSGRTLGTLALAIADAGARQARPILEEVAAKASLRIGRAVRDATRNPINASVGPRDGGRQPPSLENDGRDRARREIVYLTRRDGAALRSAVSLAEGASSSEQAALEAAAADLLDGLRAQAAAALRRLGDADGAAMVRDGRIEELTRPSGPVPRRTLEVVPPGLVGLSYEETAALVEAMRAEDSRVTWETLRLFADELWNFADGRRTLGEIAEAVTFEFGFTVGEKHFLTMARGLERTGLFALNG